MRITFLFSSEHQLLLEFNLDMCDALASHLLSQLAEEHYKSQMLYWAAESAQVQIQDRWTAASSVCLLFLTRRKSENWMSKRNPEATFVDGTQERKRKNNEMNTKIDRTWSVSVSSVSVSVSFSCLTMSPILGLLYRSTSTQLKAISMHFFTCSEYYINKCFGVLSSLILQFLSAYQFRTWMMVLY